MRFDLSMFLCQPDIATAEAALARQLCQRGSVVGDVVLLQVQESSVKIDVDGVSTYTTIPLRTSSTLQVGPDGCAAIIEGASVVDVHHRAHPNTKNRGSENGLSVGFSYHYALIAATVRREIPFGCAGENVIVASRHRIVLGDLAGGVGFLDSQERLTGIVFSPTVITPCRTFSRYLLASDVPAPAVLKRTLQALDKGTRGYFGSPSRVFSVHTGDRLIALKSTTEA